MNKVLKIITICILISLAGLLLDAISDEIKKVGNMLISGKSYTFKDPTLFIPITFLILCVPSIKFQFKTLKHFQKNQIDKVGIIDQNLTNKNSSKVEINRFLEITNFLVAIYLIVSGILVFIGMDKSLTLDNYIKTILRYLIVVVLLFFGFFMISDQLKIKKQATTQV